jgi:hypothetical protein
MCGRVVVAMDSETLLRIAKAKQLRNGVKYKQSYNMMPGRYLAAAYKGGDSEKIENIEHEKEKEKEEKGMFNLFI